MRLLNSRSDFVFSGNFNEIATLILHNLLLKSWVAEKVSGNMHDCRSVLYKRLLRFCRRAYFQQPFGLPMLKFVITTFPQEVILGQARWSLQHRLRYRCRSSGRMELVVSHWGLNGTR